MKTFRHCRGGRLGNHGYVFECEVTKEGFADTKVGYLLGNRRAHRFHFRAREYGRLCHDESFDVKPACYCPAAATAAADELPASALLAACDCSNLPTRL